MSGVIVTGGKSPEYKFVKKILQDAQFVIAADSGFDTLNSYGLEPDLVLGDMDSIENLSCLRKMDPEKIMRYDSDKDFTDTELALDYLRQASFKEKVIIGGGGGRFDHQLAIYSLFFKKQCPTLWITQNEKIYLVENNFSISLKKNTVLSLFPVSSDSCRMTSRGLKWELDTLEWSPGDAGISNVALSDPVQINMRSGKLIMIVSLDD